MSFSFQCLDFVGGVGMWPKVAREVYTCSTIFAIDGNEEFGGVARGEVVEVNKIVVNEINNEGQIGTLGHLSMRLCIYGLVYIEL